MRVQAYIELDEEIRTEEQQAAFDSFCSQFLLNYNKIHVKDAREYYHCIIVDSWKIPTMVSLMAGRHPVINGCWGINGNVYNAAQYPFDLDLHLLHTPPEQSVTVINGEYVMTETAVTEFRPIHGYAGWALPTEY